MSGGGAALNFFEQFGQVPPCSVDAGHVRLDRRNLDVIVGLAGELRGLRDIGAAMLTGAGGNLAILRGIWMQRPMRASVRLAALFGARAFVLARGGGRGFLPLARGVLELSGVFFGRSSLASSSAHAASNAR